MNLFDLLKEINETSNSIPPSEGAKEKVNTKKNRVHVYNSIKDALAVGFYGQIFSTKGADRLYVITKPTWGSKSRASGNKKVAKGFSDTIPHKFSDIKAYAVKTMKKHGGQHSQKFEKYKKHN